MSELKFHRCRLCGVLFYSYGKDTYCRRCVPAYRGGFLNRKHLSELDVEEKRERERKRWKARMANPAFREAERLRSIRRYEANKKYAVGVKNDN